MVVKMTEEEENDKKLKDFLRAMDEYFEKNKKPTLYEEILNWYYNHDAIQSGPDIANEIVRIVRDWLPKEDPRPSYSTLQWDKCVKSMHDRLGI
jgi:hypothetical protein